ncbi:MAG: hypothetical protein AAGI50_12255, partial [Pseudomonadota bacterium]
LLSRTNYFDGRLLRASDLIRDQLYLYERLREVGRVMVSGVVQGFEVSLGLDGRITVGPGLAVARSGRVLELSLDDETTAGRLEVNLFDMAEIRALNPDLTDRLETGLYVVAVGHAVRGEGVSEVFPTDLAGARGFHFNAFEEGVELALIPLDRSLPATTRLAQNGQVVRRSAYVTGRAALVRDLIANPGQPAEIGDDMVALGLLAVEQGQPIWLDEWLVRRVHRAPTAPYKWQQDLTLHYEALLADVVEDRALTGRAGSFRASSFFELLPPAGRLPVDGVDPQAGLQSFFPDHFEVEIAPVRQDDLSVLFEEAQGLDPIDLSSPNGASILVLAPLGDVAFGHFARQLEDQPAALTERVGILSREGERALDAARSLGASSQQLMPVADALDQMVAYFIENAAELPERLPSLDPLTLRLRPSTAGAALDTDAVVWAGIHAAVQESGGYWYMRRPPRTAETGVSSIVIARGYAPPEPGTDPATDTQELEDALSAAEAARDAAEAQVTTLETQIETLEETIAAGSEADIAALEARLAALTAQLAAAQATAGLVPGLQDALAGAQAEIAELRARIAALEGQLDDSSEADALRAQISTLEGRLASAQSTISRLEGQLRGREIDLDRVILSRRIATDEAQDPALRLADTLRDETEQKIQLVDAISVVPDGFESALWPTLLELVRAETLRDFTETMLGEAENDDFPAFVSDLLPSLGVSPGAAGLWRRQGAPGRDTQFGTDLVFGGGRTRIVDTSRLEIRPVEELVSARDVDERTVEALAEAVGDDEEALRLVNVAAALVPDTYDPVLWQTLQRAIGRDTLPAMVELLEEGAARGQEPGLVLAAQSTQLGLTGRQRTLWTDIALGRP